MLFFPNTWVNSNTMNKIDEKSQAYLTTNIVTYIGNKRKLLGFIDTAIEDIVASDPKLSKLTADKIRFFDIFSGSGVVSRLSKAKGFTTFSNDLEVYSAPIAEAFINTAPDELNAIFEPVIAGLVSSGKISQNLAGGGGRIKLSSTI